MNPSSLFGPAFSTFASLALATSIAHADPPTVTAPPPTPPASPSAPTPPRPVYRFDVTIAGVDQDPRAPAATFALNLEENQRGGFSTGSNVPLTTGNASPGAAVARQDVGLHVHFSFVLRGSTPVVSGNLELSSVDAAGGAGPSTVHRFRVEGFAAVTPGSPAMFASLYDLTTRRRYEVTIGARRLL
jgi:hypothetical protein